jgi:hypothetical protein
VATKKAFVVAITSFSADVKGEEHVVHSGDVLPATDPVAKAHPELFEPAVTTAER